MSTANVRLSTLQCSHFLSRDSLIVTSVAVIAIMVSLLDRPMADITHDVLSCGIVLELLGLFLLISLPNPHPSEEKHIFRTTMAPAFLAGAYMIPIAMGILGLSAVIAIERIKTSFALAMVMSCILIVGGMLCILAWVLKVFGRF